MKLTKLIFFSLLFLFAQFANAQVADLSKIEKYIKKKLPNATVKKLEAKDHFKEVYEIKFKQYLDEVLTAGYGKDKGMWSSDGRDQKNPEIKYGTGGLLHNKNYVLTTSWNAPQGAFSLPDEFFKEISVDDGPMSGFHGMNRYLGLELLESLKFFDVEKNADTKAQLKSYKNFLNEKFGVKITSPDYEVH